MITPLTSPSDLAYLLGTSLSKLSYVVYGIGTANLYTSFEILKKNGEKRTIRAPNPQLKTLQARLKTHLENLYKPHIAASAFIKDRGIVFNAKKHLKKKIVFNIDLSEFYHHINFGRIRGLLMAPPYSLQKETATLIAHICCVDRLVPQGAPTSPIISNMICRKLDRELALLAKKNRFVYSRYADDITFSSHMNSHNNIYEVKDSVRPSDYLIKIIESNGFYINQSKTRLQTNKQRQVVTGLKVNKIVNVDRRYIRTTKALIHAMQFGIEEANEVYKLKNGDSAPALPAVVHGRINYIGMVKGIESSVFYMLATKYNNLDLPNKIRISPRTRNKKLEEKLHFYGYENRRHIERCVWVVSFSGIEGLNVDQELVQATAFMCDGQRMFTAAHVFAKAGDAEECIVYRINEQDKKYRARVVASCKYSDIAELKIEGDKLPYFQGLKLAPDLNPGPGYRLSLIGFPQLMAGHDSVSIVPCMVVSTFTKSTFRYGVINSDVEGGNSGGPLVNAYMQVVGMAVTGKGVTIDNDIGQAYFEGSNTFISAQHFDIESE